MKSYIAIYQSSHTVNSLVKVPLNNVKNCYLWFSTGQELLDNVSTEETTSADHQVGFAVGHREGTWKADRDEVGGVQWQEIRRGNERK